MKFTSLKLLAFALLLTNMSCVKQEEIVPVGILPESTTCTESIIATEEGGYLYHKRLSVQASERLTDDLQIKVTHNQTTLAFTQETFWKKATSRPTAELLVPTAFSPNNDSINDIFQIIAEGNIVDYHVQMYSRWGELVFEAHDINTAWDGTSEGESVPQGTYFYVIDWRYISCSETELFEPEQIKGTLSVIR